MPPASTPKETSVQLSEWLTVLANPIRLRVLEALREPSLVTALDVRGPSGRALTRQAVQAHVDRLEEAGFVKARMVPIQGRRRKQYQADGARVFAASETLRTLGTRLPQARAPDDTVTAIVGARTPVAKGPRLVLLHGVREGAVFPLARRQAGADGWLVGRGRDCQVRIRDDHAVSQIQAAISRDLAGRYHIRAAAGTKNPTLLNWAPLLDTPQRLQPGDLVQVGVSKLVFRDA